MKLQNTFVQSKMNTDIDERLLPKGQYPDAVNIRVANTEGSDVGAIENVKGNEKLTDLGLTNAETIGTYADGASQKLYWFIKSDTKDLVMEYDVQNARTNILLESTNPNGVLNFDRNYLITGVVKVINGDSDRDLLIWTDDLNPPRVININRAKGYGVDGFDEQDISLLKRAPRYAPEVVMTNTPLTTENELVNKFYSFAYRYKYLDGGNSPLSSFTNYQFSPSKFDMDYQTMENRGMANSFNAIKIEFNTGDHRVTDVELVYKESGSNTVFLIETFNKANQEWSDNVAKDFTFFNNKSLVALPQDELFRTFDNIPRQAKALELMGSRIAFGNYVEQYDLTNIYGDPVHMDYSLSLINLDITGEQVNTYIGTNINTNDLLTLDFSENISNGLEFTKGNKITIDVRLDDETYAGFYNESFDFILNKDFEDVAALAVDDDFKYLVEILMTTNWSNSTPVGNPPTPILGSPTETGFSILAFTSTSLKIKAPVITYDLDPTGTAYSNFQFNVGTDAFYKEVAIDTSVKTNRSYEAGIVYLDEDGRTTTTLTDPDNTIYVDQEFSTSKNKIVVNINHKPPHWADRYKLVFKQNKGSYQTIYTNLFYEDGLYRWVKLEGANIGKVAKGDTLIVKSDLGGAVEDIVKTRVLDIVSQPRDFIKGDDPDDPDDPTNLLDEESGLYMKIKPKGFDMSYDESTILTYEGSAHLRYPTKTYTSPKFGEVVNGVYQDKPLSAGSRVTIKISFKARGTISYFAEYEKSFRVEADYVATTTPNKSAVQNWFEAEVTDLGDFGKKYTRDPLNEDGNTGQYYSPTTGLLTDWHDEGTYDNGYGFDTDGERFYVWAHRNGTATRRITTHVDFEILNTDGVVIFETLPEDKTAELYYETAQTFDIVDNLHQGNVQNQSLTEPSAIVESDFFNCYVQGNGAESYRYLDALNVGTDDDGNQLRATYLDIDLRPTTTSEERYREVRRYADITYSEPYNENTNLNGLGVFNLAKANYKEDIEKKYGFIQKLYARDTNLLVMQEDKISKVLFGKNIITNADGTSNVSTIEDVLGQQVMYSGEYGISRNPESFAFDSANVYFIDSKRGCVCRLGAQGITEISMAGMRTFFKDDFRDSIDNKKLGTYDPYLDQYVVHSSTDLLVKPIDMDCSGVFYRGNTKGVYIINIDYGVTLGDAGFSYVTNGVPVNFILEYNGVVTDYGYFGDPSYDAALATLGLPATVGVGTGSIVFDKNINIPRGAKLTVTAPIEDTNIQISGTCIAENELTVVNVILNDITDKDTTIKSRYKWSTDTYSSDFTTYDSVFGEGEVDLFEPVAANEGTTKIPLTGSSVRIESYQGTSQNLVWDVEENQIGYLISNTLYNEAQVADLVTAANFPVITEDVNGDGSFTRYIEFNYDRVSDEQYLYIIWDYRDTPPEVVFDPSTKIIIELAASPSMATTYTALEEMRDTLLKPTLLPLYGNDSALYDANVLVRTFGTDLETNEKLIKVLNMRGETPDGSSVITIVYQDNADYIYYNSPFDDLAPLKAPYIEDLAEFRARLATFPVDYYRGVVFQVQDGTDDFKRFVRVVEVGDNNYSGTSGLSDKTEILYKYDIIDGGIAQYYMDNLVLALQDLGYEL